MSSSKKKGGVWNWLQWVVLAVILVVLVVSGYNFLKEFFTYKQAADEYKNLENMITVTETVEGGSQSPENGPRMETQTAQAEEAEDEGPKYPPITYPKMDIDYKGLKEVNEDFVGVIYIPTLDLKYPIAHSRDNDEYLRTTFEGTKNPSGSIFLDQAASEDFSDSNTFIFGHNMKNQTMFGSLKRFDMDKTLCAQDPYFYIYSDGIVRKYAIFAYYTVPTDDDMYLDFEGDDGYDEYVNIARSRSTFSPEEDAILWDYRPNLVTLSTCWSTGHVYNFVVQGAFVGSAEFETKED